MSSFIRILGYVRRYRTHAILNAVFNVFAIIFSLVSLTMMKIIQDGRNWAEGFSDNETKALLP